MIYCELSFKFQRSKFMNTEHNLSIHLCGTRAWHQAIDWYIHERSICAWCVHEVYLPMCRDISGATTTTAQQRRHIVCKCSLWDFIERYSGKLCIMLFECEEWRTAVNGSAQIGSLISTVWTAGIPTKNRFNSTWIWVERRTMPNASYNYSKWEIPSPFNDTIQLKHSIFLLF